ncbi:urease accessory protein [Paenibacillus sp. DS2015]|uniref:urease accessory UreF family protein n=1 Tax=Paenibacillus sp. DS2015 TaxID=3373917 RepID=UPI003D1CAE2D
MDKGRKLLDYVQRLDSSLSVGGFKHTFELESQMTEGNIQNCDDLELFMRSQLPKQLLRRDGWAIKEIYAATEGRDSQRIALIDRAVQGSGNNEKDTNIAQKSGKRLFKLARALYPWMDFDELEQSLNDHDAVGCLTTVHAWINSRLEINCDQAVQGYMCSAVSTYVSRASILIQLPRKEADHLTQTFIEELGQEWHTIKMNSPEVLQQSPTT